MFSSTLTENSELPRGVRFDHLVASDPELIIDYETAQVFSQTSNDFDSCDYRMVFGDRCHEAKSLVSSFAVRIVSITTRMTINKIIGSIGVSFHLQNIPGRPSVHGTLLILGESRNGVKEIWGSTTTSKRYLHRSGTVEYRAGGGPM